MKKQRRRLLVGSLAGACAILGGVVLDSGAVRDAGWPNGLADLEGRWVLDHVSGEFDAKPPSGLAFSAGSGAGHVRITADGREAEFVVRGLGQLVFAGGPQLEPLIASGAAEVYAMTHLCPPLPAWDHLTFFPDGPPMGWDPLRRSITYERD